MPPEYKLAGPDNYGRQLINALRQQRPKGFKFIIGTFFDPNQSANMIENYPFEAKSIDFFLKMKECFFQYIDKEKKGTHLSFIQNIDKLCRTPCVDRIMLSIYTFDNDSDLQVFSLKISGEYCRTKSWPTGTVESLVWERHTSHTNDTQDATGWVLHKLSQEKNQSYRTTDYSTGAHVELVPPMKCV